MLQSCPILCESMDCSPSGSSVHRILKGRILVGCHTFLQGTFPTQGYTCTAGIVFPAELPRSEWVSEWRKSFSCAQLFATPWTIAYQASLSMGFSRQGYWSGLPFPSPEPLRKPQTKVKSYIKTIILKENLNHIWPLWSTK